MKRYRVRRTEALQRAQRLRDQGKNIEFIMKKTDLRHDLVKAYNDLDRSHQTLSKEERRLLISANKIYVSKEFEYLNMVDVAKNYQRFPDLKTWKVGKQDRQRNNLPKTR